MTYYAHVVDVQAPATAYDATHAELLRRTGGRVDGPAIHLYRATESGFQVVEVWTDRAAFERAEPEHVGPILAELATGAPGAPFPPPRTEEFTVRGLVVPAGRVLT